MQYWFILRCNRNACAKEQFHTEALKSDCNIIVNGARYGRGFSPKL